ncbi:hypothetical protein BOX15_Mlig002897g3, partial [Macrostomum lignano]
QSAMCRLEHPVFLLQLLLLPLILLPGVSSQSASFPVYNCSDGSSPAYFTPTETQFGLRLEISEAVPTCHVLIRNNLLTSAYYYIRVNGSLKSTYTRLSLSTNHGSGGEFVASLTSSNDTVYRAFATPGNSLYAILSSSLPSPFYNELIMLDIEAVHGCPSWWVSYNNKCFGSARPDASGTTFNTALGACRQVRANLALSFDSSSALKSATSSSGWSSLTKVWLGAADSSSGVYFLDANKFLVSSSGSLKFYSSSSSSSGCSTGSCRCVIYRFNSYYRENCWKYLRYLCSSSIGGESEFHNLTTLDRTLSSKKSSSSFFSFPYWSIGLIIGGLTVLAVFGTRMAFYHRAVAAQRRRETAGTGAGTRSDLPPAPPGSYPVQQQHPPPPPLQQPAAYDNSSFNYPNPAAAGAPMPPAYNAWYMPPPGTAASAPTDADVGDKPPPYEAAAGMPNQPMPPPEGNN